MIKKYTILKLTKNLLSLLIITFTISLYAEVLDSTEIIRLKEAGAGEDLIQEIIRTNAIYRALATVDGIIEMKDANVSDEVIITMLRAGNPTIEQSATQEELDNALAREIERAHHIIALQRSQLDLAADYLERLITNEQILQLVEKNKINSEDYREIVKFLKQYARDEDTDNYDDDGDDINVDIK